MAYKIQHLGLGGILDQAIAITKDHFGLLFTIMLILVIPYQLVTGFIQLSIAPHLAPGASLEEIMAAMDEANQSMGPQILLWVLSMINGIILLPLANASVMQAVARVYLGQPITAIDAIRHGLRRLLPLIGTTILMYIIIFLGLVLLIIPGILFMLWYSMSQYVVVIEELAGMAALKRSKFLVRPHLGTLLVLGLILLVITMLLYLATLLIPQRHLELIVTALVMAVTTILWTAAGVVFYFSCRCAVENFDLHYLAEAIKTPETPAGDEGQTQRAF
jgi:hypothetical protein